MVSSSSKPFVEDSGSEQEVDEKIANSYKPRLAPISVARPSRIARQRPSSNNDSLQSNGHNEASTNDDQVSTVQEDSSGPYLEPPSESRQAQETHSEEFPSLFMIQGTRTNDNDNNATIDQDALYPATAPPATTPSLPLPSFPSTSWTPHSESSRPQTTAPVQSNGTKRSRKTTETTDKPTKKQKKKPNRRAHLNPEDLAEEDYSDDDFDGVQEPTIPMQAGDLPLHQYPVGLQLQRQQGAPIRGSTEVNTSTASSRSDQARNAAIINAFAPQPTTTFDRTAFLNQLRNGPNTNAFFNQTGNTSTPSTHLNQLQNATIPSSSNTSVNQNPAAKKAKTSRRPRKTTTTKSKKVKETKKGKKKDETEAEGNKPKPRKYERTIEWHSQIDNPDILPDLIADARRINNHITSPAPRTEKADSNLRQVLYELAYRDGLTLQALEVSGVMQRLEQIMGSPAGTFPSDIVDYATELYMRFRQELFSTNLWEGLSFSQTLAVKDEDVRQSNGWKLTEGLFRQISRPCNVRGHNGLMNGQWWPSSMAAMRDGAHGMCMRGIHGDAESGAFSILMNGKDYTKDNDQGETVEYCGQKNTKEGKTSDGTKQLIQAAIYGSLIRVIRGSNLARTNPYRPTQGFRYDGLYRIIGSTQQSEGNSSHTFTLQRVPNQPPIRIGGEVGARPSPVEIERYQRGKQEQRRAARAALNAFDREAARQEEAAADTTADAEEDADAGAVEEDEEMEDAEEEGDS